MIKYFFFLLKKRLLVILTMTIVFTLLAVLVNNTSPYFQDYYYHGELIHESRSGIFLVFSIGLIVLGLIASIVEFSFKMSKNTAQQAYSFPIKRKNIYLARYIMGMLEVIIPFTVAFYVSVAFIVTSKNYYLTEYLYSYYPVALISGILGYSYVSFFYSRANNITDGLFVAILAVILPSLVDRFIGVTLLHFTKLQEWENSYGPYAPLVFQTVYSEAKLVNEYVGFESYNYFTCIIFVLIDIATIVGHFILPSKEKFEDVGGLSTSVFAYRILLPVTFSFAGVLFSVMTNPFIIIVTCTLLYLGEALAGRSFDLSVDRSNAMSISILAQAILGVFGFFMFIWF